MGEIIICFSPGEFEKEDTILCSETTDSSCLF
jgi:hypothetical protein